MWGCWARSRRDGQVHAFPLVEGPLDRDRQAVCTLYRRTLSTWIPGFTARAARSATALSEHIDNDGRKGH